MKQKINQLEKELERVNKGLIVLYEFGTIKQIETYEKLCEKLSDELFRTIMDFYKKEERK